MTNTLLPSVPALSAAGVITPDGKLPVATEAQERVTSLLAEAIPIKAIASVSDRDMAINISARISGELKAIEKERETIKAPFYAYCKAIDATAKSLSTELETARGQINRLVGAYEKELDNQRIREEQARKAEADRLLAEEQAKLAEAAAKVAPLARQEDIPPDKRAELLAAQMELEDAEAELAAKRAELAAPIEPARPKATGGAKRTEWVITVTDIKALAAAYPQCVKPLEADLSAIRYLLNGGITTIPGVSAIASPIFTPRAR